ncbi:hypothetical protein BS101_03320 [Clostridium kluyveri]|uniref:DUF445 domain-containing protein n=2 Tax=Clostridium kluyveri TaxID=1534 RepID=A0A1L5F4A7_CLOKL|nr:hypothetical protein BS101_03320 [Clostridium kluyveri]
MNRYKATIILIIVTIGYLITCPFYKTFWGGLISSAFCASMIGGFADWYGIIALFKKPLGIPFKTEIIPRNREKILDGLVNMVTEELLSREYLKNFLLEYDTSKPILKFLFEDNGDKDIKKIVGLIVEESLTGGNRGINSNSLINRLMEFNLWKAIISSLQISLTKGGGDKVINFIIEEIQTIIKTEKASKILEELVSKTKVSYERGARRRAIVNTVVLDFILNLSPDKIAVIIQKDLVQYLNNIKNLDNEERIKFKKWIVIKLNNIVSDEDMEEKFKAWKINGFKDIGIDHYTGEQFKENKIIKSFTGEIENEIYSFICKFRDNIDMQKKVDVYLKTLLNKFIDNFHNSIGEVIKENLNKYSNDMLIELIESKAGNDLQLIRINGSVVGGLVGVLFFLLNNIF